MSTPFIDFKAVEITPERQNRYFVKPDYIEKLISPKASLIIGERGSGKTTLLRSLEKLFNESESLEYVGIYYRFETAYVKALNNPEMSKEQNIMAFSQSIAAVIAKLMCGILESIKKKRKYTFERESILCRKIAKDIELQIDEDISTFEQLANVFEMIRKKTLINSQNGKSICYFDYTTFVSEFCEELRKEDIFGNTCFCVLFDEYENLTHSEQRVVNSLIKASSYMLTYKVCMRPEGFLTKETVAEKEQLIFGHDYEEFDYVRDIVGIDKVKKHLRNICTIRLECFYDQLKIEYEKSALQIDNYLEIIKEDKEIASWERIEEYKEELREELRQKYPEKISNIEKIENVIDLKLIFILYEKRYSAQEIFDNFEGSTEKYKNWIHNYKNNIIFQIISECEQTKKYCGLDTIIKLANGNVRRVLEILHYAFGDYTKNGHIYGMISVKKQTDAVNRVADSSFQEIDYIPVNGYKAKNLANALGNLFAEFLQDQRAKKFEVNSFSIVTTNKLEKSKEEELKAVIRDAIVWGVLIPSKANKVKNMGDIVFDGRDYILHPIFAPYFKISYRKRQKCELKDIEVYSMLRPNSRKEIKAISKELNCEEYVQQKLEFV